MGVKFRAVGQEPGWALDLVPTRWVRYTGDYGATWVYGVADAYIQGKKK